MNKRIIVGLAAIVIAILAAYTYYDAKQIRESAQRVEAIGTAARNSVNRTKEVCYAAIRQDLAPRQVLDFIPSKMLSGDLSNSYAETESGYSYAITADLGEKKLAAKCYLDHSYRIIKVSQDPDALSY